MRQWCAIATLYLIAAGQAQAAPGGLVTSVESPVYETPGEPPELARKASVCMGKILKPGFTTAPTIIAQDIEGGRIVANNAFNFGDYFMFKTITEGRSTLTFEARPGRFRLVNTDIQEFTLNSWSAVLDPKKPRADDIRGTLNGISDRVAKCVMEPADNW